MTASPAPSGGKPPVNVDVRWTGGTTYEGGRPDRPKVSMDTSGKTGPGPVETLLLALTTCTSEDILGILEKRRTPVSSLRIEAQGLRANAVPARLVSVALTYHIEGEGVEPEQAVRAVDLAVNKYCSVRSSLDPAIRIEMNVIVNGERARGLEG
ncbi:MAG TPA: OsmC family protein [Gemmatimonadaceae bacterium]|nr:OsmC family protein [Gemmatimonadaceae bacterium]